MRDVHNRTDLDMIATLVKLVESVCEPESAFDMKLVLDATKNYLTGAHADIEGSIRCDGLSDLPFPPVLAAELTDSPRRIQVVEGEEGSELSFCSLWCMMGHYLRQQGMSLLPLEDQRTRMN